MKKLLIAIVALLLPISASAGLLWNMTPGNYTIPQDWTLVTTDNFEGTNPAGTGQGWYDGVQDSTFSHSGSKSWRGTYSADQNTMSWLLGTSKTTTFDEVYISFYEYIQDTALFNDEFFLARFYKENTSGLVHEVIVEWFWARDSIGGSNAFNGPVAEMVVNPQGKRYGLVGNKLAVVPSGAWVQWEIHYRPNTSTGGVANADGFIKIYKNGDLFTSASNVNLNGAEVMSGFTKIQITGVYTKLTWSTTKPVIDGGTGCPVPIPCSSRPGVGGDRCYTTTYKNTLGANQFSNPLCNPTDPPLPTFRRWLDDIIVMKKIGPGGADAEPPYVDTRSPASSATGVPISNRTISLHVKDGTATTVNGTVNIEGTNYTCGSGITCTGQGTADMTVTYVKGSDWSYGQTVNVSVSGFADAAGNTMGTTSWSYTTASEPGGALPGTDDFNRASLGSEYTAFYGGTVPIISSNQLAAPDTVWRQMYRNDWSGGQDQYSQIQLIAGGGTTSSVTVNARVQADANTQYQFRIYDLILGSSSAVRLVRSVNASDTTLAETTHTFSANDNVRISTVGSNPVVVKGYVNDVEVLSYSDSSASRITGGYPGWALKYPDVRLDNAAWSVEGAGESATLAVTTTTMPNGTEGQFYSQTLSAEGGTSPYTWSIVADALPTGLSLASATGVISGVPTTAGSSSFTVQATDSAGSPATDNQVLSITINPAAPTGQTTVIINAITDTWINSGAADTNYSSNTQSRVYQWPYGTVVNRSLIEIDHSALPANITITAATLEMYLEGHDGSGGTDPMPVYAYRLSETLPTISTVTWDTYAATPGAYVAVTNVGLTPGWITFNLLEAMQASYAAGTSMTLALDGATGSDADTNRIFASIDHGTTAWRPRLKVSYTQLSAPAGPSTLTPGKGRWKGPGRFRTFH